MLFFHKVGFISLMTGDRYAFSKREVLTDGIFDARGLLSFSTTRMIEGGRRVGFISSMMGGLGFCWHLRCKRFFLASPMQVFNYEDDRGGRRTPSKTPQRQRGVVPKMFHWRNVPHPPWKPPKIMGWMLGQGICTVVDVLLR